MKKTMALLLLAVLLSACSSAAGEHGAHSHDAEAHGAHDGHGASTPQEDVQAEFKLGGDAKAAQDTPVSIRITGKDGQPIQSFDISHEKQLHLIIVSKDLSYFHHIHPDYQGDGLFTISTSFPAGGDYKLFADFTPAGGQAVTKSQWVAIQGASSPAEAIEPDAALTKSVDGKEITLSHDSLSAGKEARLTFTLKNAADGAPITNLQPYLGAVGHVVILSANAETYLHVHPVDEAAAGPEAAFATQFPESGIYKLWAQFQHEGQVITVPFTIRVP